MVYGDALKSCHRLSNRRGEASVASTYLMTVMLVTGGALGFQRAFTHAYTALITQQLSAWDDLGNPHPLRAQMEIRPH